MNIRSQSSSDGDLLNILMALLNERRITAEKLEKHISEHPGLLDPEAQMLLSIIAEAQDSPEARHQVEAFAKLLVRLQTESVHAVLSSEVSALRRRLARQTREARLNEAREKFLSWRGEAEREPLDATQNNCLPSLSTVISVLQSISTAEHQHAYGRDLLNPQTARDSIPGYLFRGESGSFPSTHSSFARLRSDSNISPRAIEDIARISDFLVAAFDEEWNLIPEQALGFLQHYGFPTDLTDVTSNATVAASFASWLRVGDTGAVCIIPSDVLAARGSLIDLRHHPLAQRPRKQSAFAVHLPEFPDLKAPEAIEALRLTWIPFRLTHVDAARFVPRFELLDARSDRVAGLIWLMISDYGKFSDAAASLLARRIDPAPFFGVVRSDGEIVILPEDDVSPENPISDDAFRRFQYESWSDKFAAIEQKPLPPELEKGILTGLPEPGSILRIMNFNAIKGSEKKKS